jgi:opacity protein-like surface antigen
MAKRFVSLLVLAAIVAGGVFAQEAAAPKKKTGLSAGVYGDFMVLSGSQEENGNSIKNDTVGGGFGAFFDAKYVELDLGLDFAKFDEHTGDSKFDLTYFSISLLGKYPIALDQKVTLFPLLGFDWNIFIEGKGDDETLKRSDLPSDYKDYFDAFLIDLGVGADFALTPQLYLRTSALWGFKLKSKWEKELDKAFTSGPTFKVGVGYKF